MPMRIRRLLVVVVVLLGFPCVAAAQPQRVPSLRVVAWNLQSGDSDPDLLAAQMEAKDGVHLWGLSEVQNRSVLATLMAGISADEGADHASILGTTGRADRLAIVYRADRFDLIGHEELVEIQMGRSGLRAPLVGHFRGIATGREFLFVVNHLMRTEPAVRHEQCRLLREWAADQTLPVICVGDFNIDFHLERGDDGPSGRDAGFDVLLDGEVFSWLRPEMLVRTEDSSPTVLDFVFTANEPFGWFGVSRILEREGEQLATMDRFDDDSTTTDHRPVDAIIAFSGGGTVEAVDASLARIRNLRAQIEALEAELDAEIDALGALTGG